MTNLEQMLLETFRHLSLEKQQDVLQFLDLIQQEPKIKPKNEELRKAREIISNAHTRAKTNPPTSAQNLWADFNRIKGSIADQYELENHQDKKV